MGFPQCRWSSSKVLVKKMSVMSSSSLIKQLIPTEPANNSTFHGEPSKKMWFSLPLRQNTSPSPVDVPIARYSPWPAAWLPWFKALKPPTSKKASAANLNQFGRWNEWMYLYIRVLYYGYRILYYRIYTYTHIHACIALHCFALHWLHYTTLH